MGFLRRRVIFAPALAWMLSRLLPARAGPVTRDDWPAPVRTADTATLRAYVDVLIPADRTPSGSALGVDARLWEVVAPQPDYRDLLNRGLAWLDERARAGYGRGFAQLQAGPQEAIVQQLAGAVHGSLQRVFFERTRADAFFHYYGRPESWPGIGDYSGAPQPRGFMHQAQAPHRRR